MALYIGLISGTSVDAIDAVLCDIQNDGINLVDSLSFSYPSEIQQELLNFGKSVYQADPIDQLGRLDHQVGHFFAQAVNELLNHSNHHADQITAIGSHGQTVRHRPDSQNPFTLQIGDANIIAAETNITTVADFRRKDMAYGGQGAPFAPAFHQQFFASPKETRAVVNLGGIANVTLLQPSQEPSGFDTGPANTLMDQWIYQHQQKNFDDNGQWALTGQVIPQLLEQLTSDDYFSLAAPKSTGCEYFNLEWFNANLAKLEHKDAKEYKPQDIQRTLLELTAITVSNAISTQMANTKGSIYLCGGGAHNKALVELLQSKLPQHRICNTQELGIHPDWVEAMAFAWFASNTINNRITPLSTVTGSSQDSILGSIHLI